MTVEVLSLVVAVVSGLLSLTVSGAAARLWGRRHKDAEFRRLLAEISLKEQRNQEITDEDVQRVMDKVSIAEYATSPEDRRLILQELLAATARQRRGPSPSTGVTVSRSETKTVAPSASGSL